MLYESYFVIYTSYLEFLWYLKFHNYSSILEK